MQRKQFLKLSCGALGLGLLGVVGSGCTAYKVYKTTASGGRFGIPLAEFAIDKVRLVRLPGSQYDILVRKLDNGTFKAVLLRCSHQDWAVAAGKSTINCTYHGSAFDLDGNVLTGPADKPLQTFATGIEGENLIVFTV